MLDLSILSKCPNHLDTLWSALLANSLHFYSSSLTHLLIPYSIKSWHSNQASQNTSSREHSLSFTQHFSYPIPLIRTTALVQLLIHIDTSSHLSIILYCSAVPTLYIPHSLCTISLSQPPSAVTCNAWCLKQFTSSNGSPFSLICIWLPFPCLEHLIILLLPTYTPNFLL